MSWLNDLNTWQSRINIGRWEDPAAWQDAVAAKARKWLKNTPKVSTPGKNGRNAVRLWQLGGLLLGLEDADARAFLATHPNCMKDDNEPVESAFLAYAFLKRGSLPREVGLKLTSIFSAYGPNDTVPYRQSSPNIRYVDTIGLLCPFLYASGMGDLADRQIASYSPALLDGLFPFHAFDVKRGLPMGVCDWGRGTGWYMLGLSASDNHREKIVRLASRMLNFQRHDGSFGCFLFNPRSRKESSATAMTGLLFTKAYKLSSDTVYLEAAQKCLQALMAMTRRDGALDYAQGDTRGIGVYSMDFDILPFAQGMSLLLAKQLASAKQV